MPTSAQFVETVRKIAAKNPDHVYREHNRSCLYFYTDNDKGACIIGKAAEELGMTRDDFPGENNLMPVMSVRHILFSDYEFGIDPSPEFWKNVCWLGKVQNRQDLGESWGFAVEDADAETNLPENVNA